MELKREHFFDGDKLLTRNVVQAILTNPNYGESIMNFVGKIMQDEEEYRLEKRRLEMKYHHDLKELDEKYLDHND